jgi:hypothetical protein
MRCVVVCDQETSKNEDAKARYRAVENTTTMGCNAKKSNKQTSLILRHANPDRKVRSYFFRIQFKTTILFTRRSPKIV